MNDELRYVRLPEEYYQRLVREAQENAEKALPFTLDELHQLLCYVGASMGGVGSPIYVKLHSMFDAAYKKERVGE
ncbi:hypothetical protein PGO05_03695 [Klebsiella aerogenes]